MAAQLLQEAALLVIRQAATPAFTGSFATSTATATSTSLANATGTGSPDAGDDKNFFEKYKAFIIGAGVLLPVQIAAGWWFLRRRKQKKAAAAAEKEHTEFRLQELEMGLGKGVGVQESGRVDGMNGARF